MATADYSKMSMEELFAEIKKLPDWERYPFPEVFYEKFNVPKPKAKDMSIAECVMYQPPPYQSLNEGGKADIRGPAEGGLRPVTYAALPVSQTLIPDESEKPKLEDLYKADFNYVTSLSEKLKYNTILKSTNEIKARNDDDNQKDSAEEKLTPPTTNTKISIQV